MGDIGRAIDAARSSSKPIFAMPPDHELKPVGFDPEKGQMGEARLGQVLEIARAFQLPPVFLQDLSKGRSEEHTSELQSLMRRSCAVFCLKKKKNIIITFSPLNNTSHYKHTQII